MMRDPKRLPLRLDVPPGTLQYDLNRASDALADLGDAIVTKFTADFRALWRALHRFAGLAATSASSVLCANLRGTDDKICAALLVFAIAYFVARWTGTHWTGR